jgi:integrase/recombinase XerD
MSPLRQRMIEDMRLRNHSTNTLQLYIDRVAKFARYFGKSPELLGPEDVGEISIYATAQHQICQFDGIRHPSPGCFHP